MTARRIVSQNLDRGRFPLDDPREIPWRWHMGNTIYKTAAAISSSILAIHLSFAGETIDLLKDGPLDAFRPVTGWRGVAEASAAAGETAMSAQGEGKILLNTGKPGDKAPYLLTKQEFGDVRIDLEFMVPRRSNSGVYLMGRYEVQIFDSFGRERPGFGDLGGIYQQFDPSRPKDHQGFAGVAPLHNAAKAPGEWQTMTIVFRAPRFLGNGVKARDAVFESVHVNGVLVQDNVSSSGHTRSAPFEGDAATGPIAIQGDHGPVAIRSFMVTPLPDLETVRLTELDAYWAEVSRSVREGDFAAYKATCHPDGVLVTGIKQTSYPLGQALLRWKREFDDAKAGLTRPEVEFRFSHRYGDATTAHEAGIFRYISRNGDEPEQIEYIHFEVLLLKRDGTWQTMMEYQKGLATQADWDALTP